VRAGHGVATGTLFLQILLYMLDMHEKILGSEHRDSLVIMRELASIYADNGEWSKAVKAIC